MEDSPDVRICGVTSNPAKARALFDEAKRQEDEWMEDEDEDSGNWAEACIQEYDLDAKPGDRIYLAIWTEWIEAVGTAIIPFTNKQDAEKLIARIKESVLRDDPDLEPYDEDETIEECMHLHNPDVMSDYYFSIEHVIVK